MKKGILGGTFDPIHNTHLNLAFKACNSLQMDQVIFMPNATPPHKPQAVGTPQQRYEMIQLAIGEDPSLTVSDYELRQAGYSYTVQTIRHLQAQEPHCEFVFIMGADSLSYIEHWKEGHTLLSLCEFAVFRRGGFELSIPEKIAELTEKYHAKIHEIPVVESALSSVMIRQRMKEGQAISGLVPQAVEEYIYKNKLYC